jgi:subtilisin family serine protease
VTGIAGQSSLSAAAVMYDFKLRKWNAAAAIKFAADRMAPGDVILLEMHAPGPNAHDTTPNSQQGFISIEYWLPEFVAIKYATGKGIYVVEAGGNGGENLDAPIYNNAYSRAARDSGAILVGGGSSAHDAHPRSRIWWSNYGSRVDVPGWGLDIVTTGGRSEASYNDRISSADESRCYTQSFGGTSGASPIITGAVASISGALKAAGRPALSPSEMRQLLVDTGTAQTDAPGFDATQHIGPLPNLRAAFSRLALGGVA